MKNIAPTSTEAGRCVRTAYGNKRLANLKIAQINRGRIKRGRGPKARTIKVENYDAYQCPRCDGLWHIRKRE